MNVDSVGGERRQEAQKVGQSRLDTTITCTGPVCIQWRNPRFQAASVGGLVPPSLAWCFPSKQREM